MKYFIRSRFNKEWKEVSKEKHDSYCRHLLSGVLTGEKGKASALQRLTKTEEQRSDEDV